MPHGNCFLWRPDVLTLHVVSDALIAIAYFSIPAILIFFAARRRDLPFRNVLRMFSLFIMACGTTHLLAIIVVWHPAYWLEGFVKAFTAGASLATVLVLIPLLPKALALRSPSDLDRLNRRLEATLAEKEQLLADYERERFIATTFQSASLAEIPERMGSLRISAVYRPGATDAEIGGDWYDALQLPDGRILISIGDVDGKGLPASVIMSKMRQAIRVAAQIHSDPAMILDAADRALRLEYPQRIVTAFVGIFDEAGGTFTYASAGHPRPLLRGADGEVCEIVGDALPLGLRITERDAPTQTRMLRLTPGSLFVFYTDGLTESTHDYAEGERRLCSVLKSSLVASAPSPAEEIVQSVLFDGARDDVAVLVVRVRSVPDERDILGAA